MESNIIPFKGIGLYIEELTVFASLHFMGSLRIEASEGRWVVWLETDNFEIYGQGSGSTMNEAVLDLYRKMRAISSSPPEFG